jgi:hypothetical protein
MNDATHAVISSAWMDKLSPGLCTSGNQCYSSAAAPTSVTIAQRTSLVVALSSLPRCPQAGTTPCFTLPASGVSADAACGANAIECFGEDDNGALQAGLVFIRGYPGSGSGQPPNPPILRDVELAGFPTGAATCSDGYFSYTSSACNLFIRAKVDVGTLSTGDVQITANGAGCPNGGCGLTFDGGTGYWTGTIPIDPGSASSPQSITISWALRNTTLNAPFGACGGSSGKNFGGNNSCVANFDGNASVQRFYRGQDSYSGPIRTATVWNDDGGTPSAGLGANSYVTASTHSLFATMTIAGSVATSSSDPSIQLRASGQGQNQAAIDCDPSGGNFRLQITSGCKPFYTLNTRMSQPDPCNPPYGANKAALFSTPNPPFWQCVGVQTGASVGQFSDGIQARVLNGGVACTGGSCPNTCPANTAAFVPGRNYWSSDWTGSPSTFTVRDDDPRLVLLFMVPFGAFRGNGTDVLYPVTNFGAFYITGWGGNGNGNNDPCPGADANVATGFLSGHFVKYKLPSNNGGGGGVGTCDPTSTLPCVAVLTQ